MNTPRTRAEFERSFNLLYRQINDGKLKLPMDFESTDSLLRLRRLPNGRMDFLSVDEMARNLANTSAQFSEESFRQKFDADNNIQKAKIKSNEVNGQD